jgi:diadenosine tetraphosphate (Ap4A) HIT family hydrolase
VSEEPNQCPFCARGHGGEVLLAGEHAFAFLDAYPVNPGHCLIVPRRHAASYFELTPEEQADIWRLVSEVQHELKRRHAPDGFNVGINIGVAAGQTVGHAHVHLIPRYAGDVPDPRGGVRWVLPARAAYWTERS